MALKLTFQSNATVPVEVEGVVPDVVKGKTLAEVSQLPVFHGNRSAQLSDFFTVEGDPSDESIHWHGDLTGVHWLGTKMSSGQMVLHGDSGRHIGSEMSGGKIEVNGNAGDWVGGEMSGGVIHVHGRAGHLIGAAYRGSRKGMTGGTILVDGDVGNEIGHTMRRGMLAVGGNAGDLIGFNMIAGSVLVFGDVGIRHGAGMRRGTIGLLGQNRPDVLPTFEFGSRCEPLMLQLVFRQLKELGFSIPSEVSESDYDLFHGDMIEGGKGEIILRAA